MTNIEELPIPQSVIEAVSKTEMARIWIADGNQVVTLSSRMWKDPGAWGIMIVDLSKHVAKHYQQNGFSYEDSLARIRRAMDAEWSFPTG